MADYSFFERIKILFGLIFSSPFFLAVVVIFLLTTFVLVLYNRIKTQYLKYGVAFGYMLIVVLVLIKYGPSIINLSDSLVDQIFSFIYFPNIISYLCMMIITTLLLIMTLINNKLKFFIKMCNIITFVIIEMLFVLTLDVIVKNGVDVYSKTEIYANETLMVLIQASTGIFCIWILVLFINFIVDFINKKTIAKEVSQLEEKVQETIVQIDNPDIVDEPVLITDEEFNKMYNKKHKKQKYEDILKYGNENNKK